MSTTTRLLTAEELWGMPNAPRCELIHGELRIMSPSGFEHGVRIGLLFGPLQDYVRSQRLGVVCGAETGFILTTNPDTVRAPDIAYVAAARIPASGPTTRFFPGAPDLAVEVVSPSDAADDVAEKVADWLRAGTLLVWVVQPKSRTIAVYDSPATARILNINDQLTGGEVLPGFTLAVAEVFR